MPQSVDVVVVGAGVIGLDCAWRIAQSGRSVVVIDPAPGWGASRTAAGMLAPVTEFGYGEQALLRLNLLAARRYPVFVAELEAAGAGQVGYERCGTLQVAWDAADLAALRDVHAHQLELGLSAELITGRQLRAYEPALASGLPGALHAPDDHQVDNRALHETLARAATAAGAQIRLSPVARIDVGDGGVTGVTLADGSTVRSEWVVAAAGAHTRRLGGLPTGIAAALRPVKGQTVRLRSPDGPLLSHVVRGSVKGTPIYLVPRASGEIVVGASSEDVGFDTRPRAGAVYDLLRDAFALLPGLAEWTWDEVSTGLRPGTPDNAPVVGATDVHRLLVATGHYRNGMLLADVTATAIAAIIAGADVPNELAGFGPARFDGVPATGSSDRQGVGP